MPASSATPMTMPPHAGVGQREQGIGCDVQADMLHAHKLRQ